MSLFISIPILSMALVATSPPSLSSPTPSAIQPTKYAILSWSRMSAADFGCYLEKNFGHKDPKFNCSLKNYVNKGHPSENTEAYYEGPAFPESKASAIHSLVQEVRVSFEGGQLQSLSLTLNKSLPEAEVRRLFLLPSSKDPRPENVTRISIRKCGEDGTCIEIEGFEHVGAGD